MSFDLSNILYAPTLKWKEGEYKGLGSLPSEHKNRIAPIFLMPPLGSFDNEDGKVLTPDEHIKSFGARLAAHWGGRLCFIDAGQIDISDYKADGAHPLKALFERSRLSSPHGIFAPATALDRSVDYQKATAKILKNNPGLPVCLRLKPEHLEGKDVRKLIDELLLSLNVRPERVVLVLDAGELEISVPDSFSELLAAMINSLPHLYSWKLLITALCSLPPDLKAPPRQITRFPRTAWQTFCHLHHKAMNGELLRHPIYSDYGTENASFAPGGGVFPATQLRYTSETEIAIHKGENTKVGGYEGIYGVAKGVMEDKDFSGGNFSLGDLEIETLATRPQKTGNASTWKKLGVIHHTTLVLMQISNLIGAPLPALENQEQQAEQELLPF